MIVLDADVAAEKQWTVCTGCNARLPLRLSEKEEQAALWICIACGKPFAGVFVHEAPRHFSSKIRLADVHFDNSECPSITTAMRNAAKHLAQRHSEPYAGPERRHQRRAAHNIEATVVELDLLYSPVGDPQNVVVHNLSPTGIGFIGSAEINSTISAIQMEKPSERLQLIAEVRHSQLLKQGISHVGMRFIQRLGANRTLK